MERKSLAERFWAKVNKNGPAHPYQPKLGRCWEWNGGTTSQGYGTLYADAKMVLATHVSWFLYYGKWPRKNCLHTCDHPSCVNPEHLYDGTIKQNMKDFMERGSHHQLMKTHCPEGHPYSEENTFVRGNGRRVCRICHRHSNTYAGDSDYRFLQCAHCWKDIVIPTHAFNQGIKRGREYFCCSRSCANYFRHNPVLGGGTQIGYRTVSDNT